MSEYTNDENTAMENGGRLAARGFVIAGGVFWTIAAFSGPYVYHDLSLAESFSTAMWPLLATIVILGVGWFYERLAAVLLLSATAAAIVWGVLYSWEIGVWILMSFVLIAPMVLASVFFALAARAEYRRNFPAEPQHPVSVATSRTKISVPATEARVQRRPEPHSH